MQLFLPTAYDQCSSQEDFLYDPDTLPVVSVEQGCYGDAFLMVPERMKDCPSPVVTWRSKHSFHSDVAIFSGRSEPYHNE